MPKTCNKCRASEWHNSCSLGYDCDNYTPLEPCPKPITIKALIKTPRKIINSCPLCLFSSGIVADGRGTKCSLCGGTGKVREHIKNSFNSE